MKNKVKELKDLIEKADGQKAELDAMENGLADNVYEEAAEKYWDTVDCLANEICNLLNTTIQVSWEMASVRRCETLAIINRAA